MTYGYDSLELIQMRPRRAIKFISLLADSQNKEKQAKEEKHAQFIGHIKSYIEEHLLQKKNLK